MGKHKEGMKYHGIWLDAEDEALIERLQTLWKTDFWGTVRRLIAGARPQPVVNQRPAFRPAQKSDLIK